MNNKLSITKAVNQAKAKIHLVYHGGWRIHSWDNERNVWVETPPMDYAYARQVVRHFRIEEAVKNILGSKVKVKPELYDNKGVSLIEAVKKEISRISCVENS